MSAAIHPGVIQALTLLPTQVVVYAPEGTCTRFRQATHADLIGHNLLGGQVLSAVVRVDGQDTAYVVPPAWIDPPDAPAPAPRRSCVVIPFPVRRRD